MNRVRRVFTLSAILVACHPKPKAAAEDAGPAPTASVAVIADAAPPPEPEKPLTWGTRPPEKGPLYPIFDGVCGGAVTTLEGKTIYAGSSGFARFEDEGIVIDPNYEKSVDKADAWRSTDFASVSGTWPRLVLYSNDRGMGRMRSFESIWVHEEGGWSYFGSSEEKDQPSYTQPIQFRDWLISGRRSVESANADGPTSASLMQAWPMKKGATPIPGLASLGRKDFGVAWLESAGDTLYAFGWNLHAFGQASVVRALKDGKVSETSSPTVGRTVVGKKDDALYVLGDDNVIRRLEGAKTTALPIPLKGGAVITGAALAANGDLWVLTSKNEVMVLHEGVVTSTTLPAPAVKSPIVNGQHGAENGLLAGVEKDDPYAISDIGALYHFENGEWREVIMPNPPFAFTGKYHARSVTVPAKGDVFVSVGYYEKGIGWKTPEAYRGVLRNKRPKETLRCNEAQSQMRPDRQEIGHGFSSAPPIADDSCPTPFVIVVRVGTKKDPTFLYDRGFPTLRAAIKETPGLGATAEILEVPWAGVQVIGLKAPDMATAKALALNAARHVKNEFVETHPEIVCGVPPTVDKKQVVDVATGKFVTTDAN